MPTFNKNYNLVNGTNVRCFIQNDLHNFIKSVFILWLSTSFNSKVENHHIWLSGPECLYRDYCRINYAFYRMRLFYTYLGRSIPLTSVHHTYHLSAAFWLVGTEKKQARVGNRHFGHCGVELLAESLCRDMAC